MMQQTLTEPPVEYEWYLTGQSKGTRYILYPEKGKHTDEDVRRSSSWLRREFDVLSLQVRWKKLDDMSPNPEKIPDRALIKELQREVGELKSYIEELEHTLSTELSKEKSAHRRELLKEVLKQEQLHQLTKRNADLNREVKKLREDNSKLITQKLNPK